MQKRRAGQEHVIAVVCFGKAALLFDDPTGVRGRPGECPHEARL
jgi:hypothetical protein